MTTTTEASYRVRIVNDDDPDLSWLDQPEWNDTSADDLSVFGVITERECPACGHFEEIDALWGVTFTADTTTVIEGTYSFAEVARRGAAGDADWQYVLDIAADGAQE